MLKLLLLFCLFALSAGQGNQNNGFSTQGHQNQGNPTPGFSTQGNQNQGNQNNGFPTQGNQNQGNQNNGFPTQGNPTPRFSTQGNQNQGNQHNGFPTQGNQNQGNPTPGYPTQGNQNQGFPTQGNQNQGNPNQGNSGVGNLNPLNIPNLTLASDSPIQQQDFDYLVFIRNSFTVSYNNFLSQLTPTTRSSIVTSNAQIQNAFINYLNGTKIPTSITNFNSLDAQTLATGRGLMAARGTLIDAIFNMGFSMQSLFSNNPDRTLIFQEMFTIFNLNDRRMIYGYNINVKYNPVLHNATTTQSMNMPQNNGRRMTTPMNFGP